MRKQVFCIFVLFCLFSSVLLSKGQIRLIHIIIELADQSWLETLIIFLAAKCNMNNAMK